MLDIKNKAFNRDLSTSRDKKKIKNVDIYIIKFFTFKQTKWKVKLTLNFAGGGTFWR